MLFKDSGFKPYVRYFKTGSGKQLSSIEIEKVEDNLSPEKIQEKAVW